MAKRRVRITMKEYNEILESQKWCAERGMLGFQKFYTDLLADHEWRRSLPIQVMQQREQQEQLTQAHEDDRRRR